MVTHFLSSDAALWCRGDQGWETAELPASLQSMPVVHLQGEEGCQRLPCSLLDPSPVLPLLELEIKSNQFGQANVNYPPHSQYFIFPTYY